MPKSIRPVVKYHGGKFYLNHWIIENFPEDYQKYIYLEPFCGAASVLVNKKPSQREIICDTDTNTIQIFRAMRDEPKVFHQKLSKLSYSQETFNKALKKSSKPFKDYLEHAVNEYVLRRMSRGGLKKTFAWSNRQRGGKPGDVNAWETALKELLPLAERLKDVHIFNAPGQEIIKTFNNENVLLYNDPPYLHETRTTHDAYQHEMTTAQHIELARILNDFKGKALISGYPSELYNRLYKNWTMVTKRMANNASQKKVKSRKIEVLWKNY